jgi:hypothetical protein
LSRLIINYFAPYTGVICRIIVRKKNGGKRRMQEGAEERKQKQKEGEKDEEGRVRGCVMEDRCK